MGHSFFVLATQLDLMPLMLALSLPQSQITFSVQNRQEKGLNRQRNAWSLATNRSTQEYPFPWRYVRSQENYTFLDGFVLAHKKILSTQGN